MNKEIEFKYNANGIKILDFHKFCINRKPKQVLDVSGFDHFYESKTDTESFYRLRNGPDMTELTFKKKTSPDNSYVRIEHNLRLDKSFSRKNIEGYCKDLGYVYNTSIFKTCFIYIYDWYTLVYYICYDTEMKELGRYIEIEMKEDHTWDDVDHAMHELISMERICKPLGLGAKHRIKTSLYEMFKKVLNPEVK